MTYVRNKCLATVCAVLLLAACGDKDHSHDTDHPVDHEVAHDIPKVEYQDDSHDKDSHDGHDDHGDFDHIEDELRQTDSHVHGDALLALALDGDELVIELETPLYNLLGFEHEPKTAAQSERYDTVVKLLPNTEKLFVVNPEAGCEAAVMADRLNSSAHQHKDGDGKTHRDYIVEYSYFCAAPDKLRLLTVNLFDHFPEMGELETVYLGPSIQTQTDLTPKNRIIKLTK